MQENLSLAASVGVHPVQNLSVAVACGNPVSLSSNLQPHQKRDSGEKCQRQKEKGALPFSWFNILVPSNNSTWNEDEKDRLGSLVALGHQATDHGEHPQRSRENSATPLALSRRLVCGDCGKSVLKKRFLEHWRIHTGDKPHACRECGKLFRHTSTFREHQKLHSGKRLFQCSDCGKAFLHKRSFLEHQRIHTGEKPLECRECGKFYRHRSTLTVHQKLHGKERPFKCGDCEKSFYKRLLQEHQRIHTKEKPLQCCGCGKFFRHRSTLSQHQKLHWKGLTQ
ncbi:zinc finger protein 419-like [Suncus etruscus]|uniref:zinc finger protein 419-like n=1 Tax=Suncus etruscus TaxID=109475 RepID=UPI0021109F7D|nr:zinc finger protein 419-like [Suncus etruscus]